MLRERDLRYALFTCVSLALTVHVSLCWTSLSCPMIKSQWRVNKLQRGYLPQYTAGSVRKTHEHWADVRIHQISTQQLKGKKHRNPGELTAWEFLSMQRRCAIHFVELRFLQGTNFWTVVFGLSGLIRYGCLLLIAVLREISRRSEVPGLISFVVNLYMVDQCTRSIIFLLNSKESSSGSDRRCSYEMSINLQRRNEWYEALLDLFNFWNQSTLWRPNLWTVF